MIEKLLPAGGLGLTVPNFVGSLPFFSPTAVNLFSPSFLQLMGKFSMEPKKEVHSVVRVAISREPGEPDIALEGISAPPLPPQ